jgi:hypothetical protein
MGFNQAVPAEHMLIEEPIGLDSQVWEKCLGWPGAEQVWMLTEG